MIPQEIVRFLEGATLVFAATRDAELKPHINFLSGFSIGEDRETFTCFFSEPFTIHLMEDLEENRQIALVVTGSTTGPNASDPPRPHTDAHETYQFKGNYVNFRPIEEADLKTFRDRRERAAELHCKTRGFPPEFGIYFFPEPTRAFTFRVREIFEQTPGPNAGRRLVPPEES